jgi:CopG family transcriptional regulator, nickel-responsive regulator
MLERIGISLEEGLLGQFDRLIADKGYVNRSEAIRDLIRDALVQREWSESGAREERVAVVTLVYDHDSSSLAHKLAHIQHENHKAVVSALHVHMDEHNCLEVLVLRGRAHDVMAMGEGLMSTRGVKFGRLVPATTGESLR